jgi:hypothetical protein
MVIWQNAIYKRKWSTAGQNIIIPNFQEYGGSVNLSAYLQKEEAEKIYSPIIYEATGNEVLVDLLSVVGVPDISTQTYPTSIGNKYYNPADGLIYEVVNTWADKLGYVTSSPVGSAIYRTYFNEYRYMMINNIFTHVKVITSGMPETGPTAIAVGGVAAGTNLKGKTAIEILDTMLYPELWPTLIAPSSTFTITPSATYQEVGAAITIAIEHDFKRGSISPAYGTSGFRSGELIDYTETGTVGPYTVVLGEQSWTSKANYKEGEQPLGSKGTPYQSKLAAGSTPVITRKIIGVYPLYATTATITTLTKQALQAYENDIIVSLVGEDGTHKQTFQIPQVWETIGIIQQYNTLSASWDNIDLSTFTKTSISINGVDYWQYVYNGSTIGSRQLKFKFKL